MTQKNEQNLNRSSSEGTFLGHPDNYPVTSCPKCGDVIDWDDTICPHCNFYWDDDDE